jgi:hypothetical protein
VSGSFFFSHTTLSLSELLHTHSLTNLWHSENYILVSPVIFELQICHLDFWISIEAMFLGLQISCLSVSHLQWRLTIYTVLEAGNQVSCLSFLNPWIPNPIRHHVLVILIPKYVPISAISYHLSYHSPSYAHLSLGSCNRLLPDQSAGPSTLMLPFHSQHYTRSNISEMQYNAFIFFLKPSSDFWPLCILKQFLAWLKAPV